MFLQLLSFSTNPLNFIIIFFFKKNHSVNMIHEKDGKLFTILPRQHFRLLLSSSFKLKSKTEFILYP